MTIVKLKNSRSYYAQFMDRSGRMWRFSLHMRSLEVARLRHEDLLRRHRAIGVSLLNIEEKAVCEPNKACKQLSVDFGDLLGK